MTDISSVVLVMTDISSVSAFVRPWWLFFNSAVISSFNWTTCTQVCSTSLCPCPPSAWSPQASSSQRPTVLTARSLPARLSGLYVQNPVRNFGNWLAIVHVLHLGRWSLVRLVCHCLLSTRVVHKTCCAGSHLWIGLTAARDLQLGGCCQHNDCCFARCSRNGYAVLTLRCGLFAGCHDLSSMLPRGWTFCWLRLNTNYSASRHGHGFGHSSSSLGVKTLSTCSS